MTLDEYLAYHANPKTTRYDPTWFTQVTPPTIMYYFDGDVASKGIKTGTLSAVKDRYSRHPLYIPNDVVLSPNDNLFNYGKEHTRCFTSYVDAVAAARAKIEKDIEESNHFIDTYNKKAKYHENKVKRLKELLKKF